MGKRKKSSRGPVKKKKEILGTQFKCVFCNHETSVSVKIDKKAGVGNLSCKTCQQTFQCGTNYLSAPVDVYSEWIDACDSVAKETAAGTAQPAAYRSTAPAAASARAGLAPGETYTEEDAGFIDDEGVEDDAADYADD